MRCFIRCLRWLLKDDWLNFSLIKSVMYWNCLVNVENTPYMRPPRGYPITQFTVFQNWQYFFENFYKEICNKDWKNYLEFWSFGSNFKVSCKITLLTEICTFWSWFEHINRIFSPWNVSIRFLRKIKIYFY